MVLLILCVVAALATKLGQDPWLLISMEIVSGGPVLAVVSPVFLHYPLTGCSRFADGKTG